MGLRRPGTLQSLPRTVKRRRQPALLARVAEGHRGPDRPPTSEGEARGGRSFQTYSGYAHRGQSSHKMGSHLFWGSTTAKPSGDTNPAAPAVGAERGCSALEPCSQEGAWGQQPP